jgi:hypothetical protein
MTRADFFKTPIFPLILVLSGCGADPEKEPAPTNQWSGHTYMLDIGRANWSQPRGIGMDIDDFVPNFLIRIDGDEPDRFNVTMGTAKADGVQDLCNQTGMYEATADGPNSTIGPLEFPLHIQHTYKAIAVDAWAYGMTITNVLPNKGQVAQDGQFQATMDFRQVYELFQALPMPTPESVCISLEDAYNVPCAPCQDGEPFCLKIEAVDLGAVEMMTEILPVTADDIDPVACTPVEEP